jgi:hypothetical protein
MAHYYPPYEFGWARSLDRQADGVCTIINPDRGVTVNAAVLHSEADNMKMCSLALEITSVILSW